MHNLRVALVPAAPDTYALMVRPLSDDATITQWFIETVVAFDADDGGAYIVGGLNKTGKLVRLDETAAEYGFDFKIWEQDSGSREEAREWASRHVKAVYEDARPLGPDDPRWTA